MKISSLVLGASLLGIVGCQTPSQAPQSRQQSSRKDGPVLPVHFSHDRALQRGLLGPISGYHRHLFEEDQIEDMQTTQIIHSGISLHRKLLYLHLRQEYLEFHLKHKRSQMPDPLQIQLELELRMIPSEIQRFRDLLRRRLQGESLEEV